MAQIHYEIGSFSIFVLWGIRTRILTTTLALTITYTETIKQYYNHNPSSNHNLYMDNQI